MPESREILFAVFFLSAYFASYFLARALLPLAAKFRLMDVPDLPRKIHDSAKPKIGGIAIFISFAAGVGALAIAGLADEIAGARLWGLIAGGAILIIGGALDDKYDLPAWKQFLFPLAAVGVVVLSGAHISYITNPLGGDIVLDQYKWGTYPLFGSLLVFGWILGMTYTTKFLDGMDGLVSGISGIAGLAIFALSLGPAVNQTTTALLALVFAAAVFGFLPWNFYPAKIFLGEGGSTFTGFVIGVLAVVSGAKIATALLVLGIPVLDAAWVIVRRLYFGDSPFAGDKKHLHFRLLDIGLSQRQAVLFLYAIAAAFGGVAIFLQSLGKLLALGALSGIMFAVILFIAYKYRKGEVSSN